MLYILAMFVVTLYLDVT